MGGAKLKIISKWGGAKLKMISKWGGGETQKDFKMGGGGETQNTPLQKKSLHFRAYVGKFMPTVAGAFDPF